MRLVIVAVMVFFAVALGSLLGIFYGWITDLSSISLVITYVLLFTGAVSIYKYERFTELSLFFSKIRDMVNFLIQTENSFISVERIRQYFDNPVEDLDSVDVLGISKESTAINPKGEAIVFDRVSLSYSTTDDKLVYALREVSLSIRKGEKVAFCGR
jgi:ABC-type multidrug transport system fused ATPase/permease subunit